MKVLNVHQEKFGNTTVALQASEFENFGNRKEELERMADEADSIEPEDIEAVQASTAGLLAHVQELDEQLQKKLQATPSGPKKALDGMMLGLLRGMLKGMFQGLNEGENSDNEENEGAAEQPEPRDPHQIQLILAQGIEWNPKTQAAVEEFFAKWQQLRPVVLNAVFGKYKKNHAEFLTLFPGHKGLRFILPKPASPESIAELFYIESMFWGGRAAVGLSGNCTWDPEHGWGILLKNQKVAEVGEADVAYC